MFDHSVDEKVSSNIT